MKRHLLFGLTLGAVGVGLIHLQIALRAVFVFREGESVWSWITVLAGPGSTLVSALVAWFSPRIGGACLLLGGGASLFAAIVERGIGEGLSAWLLMVAVPMLGLGSGLIVLKGGR